MRFISPAIHGIIDYLVAVALVAAPALIGASFNAGATPSPAWLTGSTISILFGVVLFLYSLLTAYPDGLVRMISYKVHLVIDTLAALALIAAPFLLTSSYGETGKWFHVGVGAAVIVVVALSSTGAGTKASASR